MPEERRTLITYNQFLKVYKTPDRALSEMMRLCKQGDDVICATFMARMEDWIRKIVLIESANERKPLEGWWSQWEWGYIFAEHVEKFWAKYPGKDKIPEFDRDKLLDIFRGLFAQQISLARYWDVMKIRADVENEGEARVVGYDHERQIEQLDRWQELGIVKPQEAIARDVAAPRAPAAVPNGHLPELAWSMEIVGQDALQPLRGDIVPPKVGIVPLTIKFHDLSTRSPEWHEWDFGDGSARSHDRNPDHTYTRPGEYRVTLRARNKTGEAVVTGPVAVHVLSREDHARLYPGRQKKIERAEPEKTLALPSAKFEMMVNGIVMGEGIRAEGDAPLKVRFMDRSEPLIVSRLYNFGDGTISTDQNPEHTFTAPGKYVVTLKVRNAAGESRETWMKEVVVNPALPPARAAPEPPRGRGVGRDAITATAEDKRAITTIVAPAPQAVPQAAPPTPAPSPSKMTPQEAGKWSALERRLKKQGWTDERLDALTTAQKKLLIATDVKSSIDQAVDAAGPQPKKRVIRKKDPSTGMKSEPPEYLPGPDETEAATTYRMLIPTLETLEEADLLRDRIRADTRLAEEEIDPLLDAVTVHELTAIKGGP